MKRLMLFANPIAGRGRGHAVAGDIATAARRRGWACEVCLDRCDLLSDAQIKAAAGCDALVTVGGDGTLAGVVARLSHTLSAGQIPPICVVPLGTANLMSRHLRLNWSRTTLADEVTAAIAAGRTQALDLADANGQPLLLIAGVGLDAQVVHALDLLRTGPISRLSYVRPILQALGAYAFPPVTVDVDGRRLCTDRPALVFVGNVPEYGTGIPILSRARSDDGLLDICVLPCAGRVDLLHWVIHTTLQRHHRARGAIYTTGRSVRVEARTPVPVQIDGEPAGHTPVTFNLLPGRLTFIVR